MGFRTVDAMKGVASDLASSVANCRVTDSAKAGWQNFANHVGIGMQMIRDDATTLSVMANERAGKVINSIADQSIGGMARSARNAATNAANHVVNTPVGTLASEAFMAGAGSRPVLALSDGIESARGYGKTLLGDIDQFYHNADGSYNRTKVGATIGAGLGIAGIVGYNMNN